jgi:hypothetical protein
MNAYLIRKICIGASVAILLIGCATTNTPKESGFLKNYSNLHKQDAPGGGARLVYLNPAFTPSNYDAIWLEPIVFYPEPQPTEEVSMETLTQIRTYIDNSLQQRIGQKVRLTDRAGPRVAHVRVAITAVGTETQALKVYQYIPIGLVLTAGKAAVEGGRPKDATIAIESSITDSMTTELLYASVRGGTGEKIEKASQGQGGVQPVSLKPLIDTWTEGAANEIQKYVVSR